MEKRYFWLKLADDFFTSKRIKMLRSLAGGDTFTIIYLKMQLKALKTEGYLYYDGIMDDFAKELALDIDEAPENVKVTIQFLLSVGLLISSEDGSEYILPYTQKLIGSEGSSAQRMRTLREKKKQEKVSQCDEGVTPLLQNRYGEIEKEKEKSKSVDIYIVEQVLDYLNQQANKAYKSTTEKTRKLIKARIKEGFTLEDFKTVIDTKVYEWGNDPKMEQYLRPETLFGTKFEGYLNQGGKRYGYGSTTVQGNAEAVPKKHNFFE